jgi:hypothetical protein
MRIVGAREENKEKEGHRERRRVHDQSIREKTGGFFGSERNLPDKGFHTSLEELGLSSHLYPSVTDRQNKPHFFSLEA